jgi:hypothetical protein
MKDAPRYLIAKYISDLYRMEPRNIGILVWAEGRAYARFLAEKKDNNNIDGRRIPAFVTSSAAYKQWVSFWRTELDNLNVGGVSQGNIEKLKQANRGNFLLTDGGFLSEEVRSDHLPELTNNLFQRLIVPVASEEMKDVALDDVADKVIKSLRLAENKHFHNKYAVPCKVAPNVEDKFEFSHAYANGVVKRLYHRIPITKRYTHLRRSVHDSAWMFEKVVQSGLIKREQAIALVYAPENIMQDPEIGWSLDVLGSVARVANLANQDEAMAAFQEP